jgi:xanthine dehydrogenase iron-sulfur cluster and FAD-binding subunit A
MWQEYVSAASVSEVLKLLEDKEEHCRIIAGGTDLILELDRGIRKEINTLIDISRIAGLDQIYEDEEETIHLGPLVTHNECLASKMIRQFALPLAQACWEVGSPQIRNRGTIAGNLITGSPANDTIPPLIALGAKVTLKSTKGLRTIPLSEFYTGVRKTIMRTNEMLVDISFLKMKPNQRGVFIKLALRRAQAISLVNTAIILTIENQIIQKGVITLGAVAPTIIHATEAEESLLGKLFEPSVIKEAASLAASSAKPISDLRGSADYRRAMVKVITSRGLISLLNGTSPVTLPDSPVLLWGQRTDTPIIGKKFQHTKESTIETRINGKSVVKNSGSEKTLLRFLREDTLLIGSKEGCAEGECGACTIFLDGKAVMGCLVPAPRAHHAEIVTIEGLANDGILHPVQQAFINAGAVQCGYCTPGFLMSAVKLYEEKPSPTKNEIRQALTGNLCRCTGYYKIIEAIEKVSTY